MTQSFERHTIYPIPLTQRFGKASDLFPVWFSANMTLLTVVTGALGPVVFKLSFLWSLMALIIGNMAGAVFMALHAAQGPQLGVPQMVQSRGQFGLYGSVPVIGVVIIMYIGFAASNCVVGGEALSHIVPVLSGKDCILLIALLTFIPCVLGYRVIHLCSKAASWLSAIAVLYAIICGLHALSWSLLSDLHGSISGMLGAISVAALWQIAYAPYVSDSSRYLPLTETSVKETFWACYGGTVIGAVLPMMLGSLLAILWPDLSPSQAIIALAGPVGHVVVWVLALAIPLGSAMSVYCGGLCILTFLQTFYTRHNLGRSSRVMATTLLLVVALFIGLGMSKTFLQSYTAFLDFLLAVLVPWTAINLYDYYILKKGHYEVDDFFKPHGGRYGRLNHQAAFCYVVGVLVELPFLKTSFFTGPLVSRTGGVDISWVAGLVVTTFLYGTLYSFERYKAPL
ncbi:cytosine permease [Acetobacteraceae bacterium ESL0709]|nr:cytosine permease [Acetobacteraceae bacterium ESL0697]MDF7678765.1 cytosine permease [Acetobacteraceae bacterium ESL0709]